MCAVSYSMQQIKWFRGLTILNCPTNGISDNPIEMSDNLRLSDFRDTIFTSKSTLYYPHPSDYVNPYYILVFDEFGVDQVR